MQRNRHVRALEDSIANFNYKINEIKYSKTEINPIRKVEILRYKVKALEELLAFAKMLNGFQNDDE